MPFMNIAYKSWRKRTVSEIEQEIQTRQKNLIKNLGTIDQIVHTQTGQHIENIKAKLRWELFMLKQGFIYRQNQWRNPIDDNAETNNSRPKVFHPIKRRMIVAGVSAIGFSAAYIKHKHTRNRKIATTSSNSKHKWAKETFVELIVKSSKDILIQVGREFLLRKISNRSGGSDGT